MFKGKKQCSTVKVRTLSTTKSPTVPDPRVSPGLKWFSFTLPRGYFAAAAAIAKTPPSATAAAAVGSRAFFFPAFPGSPQPPIYY